MTDSLNPIAASQFGKYSLLREIGKGGMSEVFLAQDTDTKLKYAVKILNKPDKEHEISIKRFVKEANLLKKMSHKNIINILNTGFDNNRYYIVMDYIDGENLRSLISKGSLSFRQKLSIFIQICRGLSYLHKHHIIHRDIKPSNILVDKKLHTYLTDFGISKQLISETTIDTLTSEDSLIGTPQYMSPEQIVNPKSVDQRSDIYSLGILFYELLHDGFNPFFDKNKITCIKNHLDMPVPAPSQEWEKFTPIFEKLLAKKAEDRFETIDDLVRSLHKLINLNIYLKKADKKAQKLDIRELLLRYRSVLTISSIILGGALIFFGIEKAPTSPVQISDDSSLPINLSNLREVNDITPDEINRLEEKAKLLYKYKDYYGYFDVFFLILNKSSDVSVKTFLDGSYQLLLELPYLDFANFLSFADKIELDTTKGDMFSSYLDQLKTEKLLGRLAGIDCSQDCNVLAQTHKSTFQQYNNFLIDQKKPVVQTSELYARNLSYSDILAYTKWLSDMLDKKVRLPTASEWSDFSCQKCQTINNPNLYGLYDVYGVLFEMTCSSRNKSSLSCSSNTEDKLVLGGSFATDLQKSISALVPSTEPLDDVGFRLVIEQ